MTLDRGMFAYDAAKPDTIVISYDYAYGMKGISLRAPTDP